MSVPNPCRWRTRVFPSQKAAAAALGVSQATVCRHLDKYGSIDGIVPAGLGPSDDEVVPTPAPPTTPDWMSHREIAGVLGVTQATVSRHISKYGHPHNIKPSGQRYRESRDGPYRMGRHVFPSRAAAGRALGLCREKLRRWEQDPVKHGQDINIAVAKYEKRTRK